MMTKTIYFLFLFFVPLISYSQTDTLKCIKKNNLPNEIKTTDLNLASNGNYFWISEYSPTGKVGKVYKVDAAGICLDSLDTYNTTCIESDGDNLWIMHDLTDWLCKLDKNTGKILDSIRIEIPEVFKAPYQSSDICYLDSCIYSIWPYCWCGKYRLLKVDLRTRLTIDLGDIPTFDKMVVINDTIWAGSRFGFGLYSIYANNSIITSYNRSLYLGGFDISCLTYKNNSLWVIDSDSNLMKEFTYPFPISNGIETNIFGNKISIYPNPTSDYITINTEDLGCDDGLIEVFDLYGKKIISEKQKAKKHKLALKQIKSGLYIVKLSNGKNKYNSVTLIKN